MANQKPLTLNIANQKVNATPENTKVRLYVLEPEKNHVEVTLNGGLSTLRLFGKPEMVAFMGGLAIPDDQLNPEEIEDQSSFLRRNYGWNAEVVIEETAPSRVCERFDNFIHNIVGHSLPELAHENRPDIDSEVERISAPLKYGYFPAAWAQTADK